MTKHPQVSARVDTTLHEAIRQSPHTVKELIEIGLGLENKEAMETQQGIYQSQLELCEEELHTLEDKKQFLEERLAMLEEKQDEEKQKHEEVYHDALFNATNYLRANMLKRKSKRFQPRISWERFKEELSPYDVDVNYVYNDLPEVLQNEVEK